VASESPRLVPGQAFVFQLRLNSAPEGYGESAKIRCFLQNVRPEKQPNAQFLLGNSDVDGNLHDGQAVYTFSLPITEDMLPGTWKLARVQVGRAVMTSLSIPDNVTFEIPGPPPVNVHLIAPETVVAGQPIAIKIEIDKYPEGLTAGCIPTLSVALDQNASAGMSSGAFVEKRFSSVDVTSDQRHYDDSASLYPDAPLGTWRLTVSLGLRPDLSKLGPPNYPAMRFRNRNPCPSGVPLLSGETTLVFTVQRAVGFIAPTSAAVTINPSQAELFQGEADHLRAEAEELRNQLISGSPGASGSLLLTSVQTALSEVDKTEAEFKKEESAPPERAVDAFFDDIRYEYGEAIQHFNGASIAKSATRARLERASLAGGPKVLKLDRASEALLSSIAHNEGMYEVAALTKALTFTLTVYSEPPGAAISYRLRGEDYHSVDHETDWQIENLPRAVYWIKLQKQGYEDNEFSFDAIDSSKDSVKKTLVAKRGAR
jgi:hypothetical protein